MLQLDLIDLRGSTKACEEARILVWDRCLDCLYRCEEVQCLNMQMFYWNFLTTNTGWTHDHSLWERVAENSTMTSIGL